MPPEASTRWPVIHRQKRPVTCPKMLVAPTRSLRLGSRNRQTTKKRPRRLSQGQEQRQDAPGLQGQGLGWMSGDEALSVANKLGARRVIPIHYEGWTHFREARGTTEAALRSLGERVAWLVPGQPTDVEV